MHRKTKKDLLCVRVRNITSKIISLNIELNNYFKKLYKVFRGKVKKRVEGKIRVRNFGIIFS